ncbi:MAG: polysaccharide export outer membrane protein [Stygiobacter sp.]|nr:MAG: polysaccharide export outer membrane protein [Stygiobacter sp.]KAF0217784.1 MAG: polysaccharide export outer membrane [Ignavibacteria bacterium]MBI5401773.1 polysaccharide biosynthesis/export family protein [Ignavibacteriota bacterium]
MKDLRLHFLLLLIPVSIIVTGCGGGSNFSKGYNAHVLFKDSNVGPLDEGNVKRAAVDTSYINFNSRDIIKSGDQLQVSVWGYPEFNTTTTVKDYGTVTIPLIGDVMAAGLTTDRFTVDVSRKLTQYVKGEPKVTVSHIDMNKRISVMGAVNKQDNYTSLSDISLVEIIAAAGGPTPDADLGHVKIFMKGKISDVKEIDLAKHLEQGDMDNIPKVRSGDTVFVPREENVMRKLSDFTRDILLLFGFFSLLY